MQYIARNFVTFLLFSAVMVSFLLSETKGQKESRPHHMLTA